MISKNQVNPLNPLNQGSDFFKPYVVFILLILNEAIYVSNKHD